MRLRVPSGAPEALTGLRGRGLVGPMRVEMRTPRRRLWGIAVAGTLLGLASVHAWADVAIETPGRVETLPSPPSPHWAWVADGLLERTALVDLEQGKLLGTIDGGFGLTAALFARMRPEIYVPETHYSRGSRGERTDVLTIWDARSLSAVGEVILPPKRGINALPVANAALSDDDRFVAVFNLTPATSLSIVDVERRKLAGEISTPGCSLVYGAGARRFAMLCADGSLLSVTLDDEGREVSKVRSQPFFDPQADPVTEKAVRHGDVWLFVSFEGRVHAVDISGDEPRFGEVWSLLSDAERERSWRIGGSQHLAVHQATGRLYALVHRGGPDTHKDPGTELWVYDLSRRERVQRIELRSPGFTYLGVPLEFGQSWVWPFNRLYDWLLALAPNLGIGNVVVTQDEQPLLVTGSNFTGSLAIYDALSGEFLRRVTTGNMTSLILQAPPWGTAKPAQLAQVSAPPRQANSGEPDPATPLGDPESCENWRYCAIDGFLASSCGGTHTSCPPGTEMSPITWLGTCRNPADGKNYVISYNDCCGKGVCGRNFCQRNEGEKPVYYTSKNNDIDWCMGEAGVIYNSTVAIVVGMAMDSE